MRDDYQQYFREVSRRVKELGGFLASEKELEANFVLSNEWEILFQCERYYSVSFILLIRSPKKREYEVGLLMETFREMGGKNYGAPTIENEFNFLIEEKSKVFGDDEDYLDKYQEISRRSI